MAETKILDQKALDNRKVIFQTIQEIGDDEYERTYNRIILPYLTDDELLARYRRIKPIVSIEELYYYLKKYNVSQMRKQSLCNIDKDIRNQVDMTGAKTIAEFPCYYTYKYDEEVCKPSISEVLQQFPDDFLDEANAFYITNSKPKFDSIIQNRIVSTGCHQAVVKALVLKK